MDPDPNPDPGYLFKIYLIFLTKNNFQIFCFIFIQKLNEPFRNEEIFIISLFFKSSDLGFRSKNFFSAVLFKIFYPLDPDPWIRILLQIRIRIQEAKILRIQRIRILNTEMKMINFLI